MSITPFQALACPLDGTPLHCTGSAWTCASGHSFDIANQGYANLLPVQHKRSRDPGDSKQMVAARRRFLTAGYYQPIAAAVSRAVLADLPAGATISCLDAAESKGLGSNNFPGENQFSLAPLLGKIELVPPINPELEQRPHWNAIGEDRMLTHVLMATGTEYRPVGVPEQPGGRVGRALHGEGAPPADFSQWRRDLPRHRGTGEALDQRIKRRPSHRTPRVVD